MTAGDDGALYGYSVFETFLALRGRFWRLKQHWSRLRASARLFGLEPPAWNGFIKRVQAAHDTSRDEVIRFSLCKRGGRWSAQPEATEAEVLAKPHAPAAPPAARLGMHGQALPANDFMRCHKTGSRMLYQSAWQAARRAGWDDCLFIDDRDRLLETSVSNIFLLVEGRWLTPRQSLGLLPGTARAWALERGLAQEAELSLEVLPICQGMALSNAATGMLPVAAIEGRELPLGPARDWLAQLGPRRFEPIA